MPLTHRRAFVLLSLAIAPAHAQQPAVVPAELPAEVRPQPSVTPMNLLAAMPLEAESVWIRNIEKLRQDEKVAQVFDDALKTMVDHSSVETDTNGALLDGIRRAKPLLHALGGSEFKMPKGLGAGEFKRREIWVVQNSVASLKEKTLDPGSPYFIKMEREGDSLVCRGKSSFKEYGKEDKPSSICFGFSGDHVVVIADSPTDVASILDRLKAPESKVPKRWEGMLDDEVLSAASFIVRSYDPTQDDSIRQLRNAPTEDVASAHRLRMVLNDAKSQPVTRCWTTEVEKTKEMLTILMSHPNYEAVEDGVIGKAWARDGEDGVLIGIFLMPMQIFGQIVFI